MYVMHYLGTMNVKQICSYSTFNELSLIHPSFYLIWHFKIKLQSRTATKKNGYKMLSIISHYSNISNNTRLWI